ncbi:MAG: Spx/MgsR family RNA polymerase-binding regulatory protein [Nitratireductor sp.]
MLTIYHLKNCDTCKKAIKALEAKDIELNLIDVRADGIDAKTIETYAKAVGFETLLNTRSTTWRGLDDSDKQNVDLAKAVQLMSEHTTLIKRPVIDNNDEISVGWSKAVQEQYL